MAMEKHWSCSFLLPLQELALRKVATMVWSQRDSLDPIQTLQANEEHDQNFDCQAEAKQKLSNLIIPEELKKRLLYLHQPIVSEILLWKEYHEKLFGDSLDPEVIEDLCWSSVGAIDYKKTAERLLSSEKFDILKLFKLACSNCLVDNIQNLSKEMPEEIRAKFYKDGRDSFQELQLVLFWSCIVRLQEDWRHIFAEQFTLRQCVFKSGAMSGSKVATEYFFPQLTKEEKEASLLEVALTVARDILVKTSSPYYAPKERSSDVLCYLFVEMSREQQVEVISASPAKILFSFLEWPWQVHFLEIAGLAWSYLPAKEYGQLLSRLLHCPHPKISAGYNFRHLFREFFLRAPRDFKKNFVDKEGYYCGFFDFLFNSEDVGAIKFVFGNLEAVDKLKFAFSVAGLHIFKKLLLLDKWPLLELFLREANIPQEDLLRFNKAFMIHMVRSLPESYIKSILLKIYRFYKKVEEYATKLPEDRSPNLRKRARLS